MKHSKSEFDAKRFVQLFMAGYVPRSKDEKKFVDKHVAQLHQDVNGNKDDVFNATNIPTHKRPPYHGYEKGQDERMYEAVDQIDEWSKDKLIAYITRATGDLRSRSFSDGMAASRDTEPVNADFLRRQKKRGMRQIGIGVAARKLAYGKVSEDAQQIDEASLTAGTKLVSKHEGADGHHAEVRYNKDFEEYQVHHYLNGKHLGEGPVSYHYDDKKDAEAVARYTTSIRNHDYTDSNVPTKRTYGKDPVSEAVGDLDNETKENIVYGTNTDIVYKPNNDDRAVYKGAKNHHAIIVQNWEHPEYHAVVHYVNDKMLDHNTATFHTSYKDAEAEAKRSTTKGNSDYTTPSLKRALSDIQKVKGWYSLSPQKLDRSKRAFPEVPDGRGIQEAIEALEEEMSDAQMAKRERIVKSMKKKAGTFKKRYGEKAEDVMYATATKMAMEDLDYVNLDMTDAVADLIESELVGKQKNIDKNDNGKIDGEDFKILRNQKGLKHMENQAKKVRDVVKKYPMAQRDESVIEQLLSQIDEETVVLEFNSGETIEIVGTLAESILNIFMELSEDNQAQFEAVISESMIDFEDALAFIAEAYEGNE